jgi:thiol-disulfide isomerase/thioredoxin
MIRFNLLSTKFPSFLDSFVQISHSGATVFELTPSEFDESLASGNWMVKFYAPWCGYCRRLEPTYEEVSAQLIDKNVKFAKVDASKYKGSCFKQILRIFLFANVSTALGIRFAVDGYPTIYQ